MNEEGGAEPDGSVAQAAKVQAADPEAATEPSPSPNAPPEPQRWRGLGPIYQWLDEASEEDDRIAEGDFSFLSWDERVLLGEHSFMKPRAFYAHFTPLFSSKNAVLIRFHAGFINFDFSNMWPHV